MQKLFNISKKGKTEAKKIVGMLDVLTEDRLNEIKNKWQHFDKEGKRWLASSLATNIVDENKKEKIEKSKIEFIVKILSDPDLEVDTRILLIEYIGGKDKIAIKFAVDELKNMVETYERTDKEPTYLLNILFIIDKYSKEDYSAISYLERLYCLASKNYPPDHPDKKYIRSVFLKVYELYSEKELYLKTIYR